MRISAWKAGTLREDKGFFVKHFSHCFSLGFYSDQPLPYPDDFSILPADFT